MTTPSPNGAPAAGDGHPRKWQILAILCSCLILVVAGVSSLNVAIPSIINALNPSATETLWIVDSYALVFAGLLLPAGALGDRYGRKGALLAGLGILTLGALAASQANSPLMLIGFRSIMGIGAALIMPATLSIIVSVFPPHERGKAIAVWAGFAGAGGAIGIIGAGVLLESFSWGSVFFINVPIALIAAGLIAALVPTSKDEHNAPLDLVGSAISIVGLSLLVYAIIDGGDKGWIRGQTVGLFAAALVILAGWVLLESRMTHPMLDPRLFRLPRFALASLTISAAFSVMFGMFFVISQYFQFVQGTSPLGAGVRTLPFTLTMVVVAPRGHQLVASLGVRRVVPLGFVMATIGFVILAFHDVDTPYALTALAIVLLAAGMATVMPPMSESIVSSLPPQKAGVGSAWNDTTREVGGALGIAVIGSLLSSGYRSGLGSVTDGLPTPAAEAARENIGAALAVAEQAGQPALVDAAHTAFVNGMSHAFVFASIVAVLMAAVVALRWPKPVIEVTDRGAEPAVGRSLPAGP